MFFVLNERNIWCPGLAFYLTPPASSSAGDSLSSSWLSGLGPGLSRDLPPSTAQLTRSVIIDIWHCDSGDKYDLSDFRGLTNNEVKLILLDFTLGLFGFFAFVKVRHWKYVVYIVRLWFTLNGKVSYAMKKTAPFNFSLYFHLTILEFIISYQKTYSGKLSTKDL